MFVLAWVRTRDAAVGRRRGVIRFQHRRKIRRILIRNTLEPSANRKALGSCLVIEASNHRKPELRVSIIPLDFQRKCEQRWAARFAQPAPRPLSPKSEQEKPVAVSRSLAISFDNERTHPT